MNEAHEELLAFQNALKEFVGYTDATYAKKYEEFYIGFEGRYMLVWLNSFIIIGLKLNA